MTKEVKKETNNKKKTPRSKQDNALLGTFITLIVLVIVLAAVALNMKNISTNDKANIVIPVLEANSESEISVDISDMTKGDTKEYIFKVSNYKNKSVIEEDITYDIGITPSENASIKLYKNSSEKNLIDENDLLIEDNKLPKNNKTEDEYHLIIEAISNPETKDVITIKINS